MSQAGTDGAEPVTSAASPASSPPARSSPPSPPPLNWRKLHAYGLPGGSVRAVLAVLIFGGIWARLWRRPERELPFAAVVGSYFGSRS